MRRSLAFFLVLLLAAIVGMGTALAAILPARDRVELTETVLYGDRAAAEGVAVRTRNTYDHYLFWDTVCALGEELAVDTDYTFSASQIRERTPVTYGGIIMNNSFGLLSPDDPTADPTGLSAVYAQMMEEVQPSQKLRKEVYLKDYFTYYPLGGYLDLPASGLSWSGTFTTDTTPEPGTEEYLVLAFQNFFRIPVLETETLELTLTANASGDVTVYGYGSGPGDSYYMSSQSVYTGDACYFTFDCHTQEGGMVDTSLIPGGYGVYRLPYLPEDAPGPGTSLEVGSRAARIKTDELAMVYPLDPEAVLLGLTLSPNQTKLLIHQRVENTYVLTVVDLADMTTLQRLEVADWPETSYGGWFLYEGDDFLVPVLGWDRLVVLALAEDGRYEIRFSAEATPPPAEGEEPLYDLDQFAEMDYDGERLAVVRNLRHERYSYFICDFSLAVYDPSGLIYFGEYANSLTPAGLSGNDHFDCLPMDHAPISVRLD